MLISVTVKSSLESAVRVQLNDFDSLGSVTSNCIPFISFEFKSEIGIVFTSALFALMFFGTRIFLFFKAPVILTEFSFDPPS